MSIQYYMRGHHPDGYFVNWTVNNLPDTTGAMSPNPGVLTNIVTNTMSSAFPIMRFGLQGAVTSDFFLGTASQANAHGKVSEPTAIAATYTTMRVKLSIAIGIGASAIFTVYDRFGATTITGTLTSGDIDKTFTVAGVLFANTNSMSVKVHFDTGSVTSPEIVVC